MGKRGRPLGHRLSESTKEKIRQKRLGTSHTKETKDKISRSLRAFFKSRDKLADSIEYEYIYISDEAVEWVDEYRDAINETESVMSEKRLTYLNQLELSFGNEIEDLFGHNATPEFFILLKERMQELKCASGDMEELYSLM